MRLFQLQDHSISLPISLEPFPLFLGHSLEDARLQSKPHDLLEHKPNFLQITVPILSYLNLPKARLNSLQ